MLQTQLPVAQIHAGPQLQTIQTELSSARPTAPDPAHRFYRSIDGISRAESPEPEELAPGPAYRFYRSIDGISRAESPEPEEPAPGPAYRFYRSIDGISRAESPELEEDPAHQFYSSIDGISRADSPEPEEPAPEIKDESSQASIENTRRGALDTLTLCQNVITTLELTRLRKSRSGIFYWLAFWERLYTRAFARALGSRVRAALTKIDILFRTVASELHQLTQRMEYVVAHALSEKDILLTLEQMEDEVGVRRRRRRKKAQAILNKMRMHMESIPVKVSDELFDDMKRGVFALDVFCDYHPGDPVAEEHESMWPEYFVQRSGVDTIAVSPYLYRQWQEGAASAASGSYIPLTSYTGNNAQVEYLEEEYHVVDNWRPDDSRSARRW